MDEDSIASKQQADELSSGDSDVASSGETAISPTVFTPSEIIAYQIPQRGYTVPIHDFELVLPGIGDYVYDSTESDDTKESTLNSRKVLGAGRFSTVYAATKDGQAFAIKMTSLWNHVDAIKDRLLREPILLASLRPHPNLIKVYESIRTCSTFYLIEESLADWITLEQLVSSPKGKEMTIEMAWSILEQLTSVVRSMHHPLRVCHRDIKPENVLVRLVSGSKIELKLIDFGLATHFASSEPKLSTVCGSPAYYSPELWSCLRRSSLRYWGPEVDVWTLALCILRLFSPTRYPLGLSHTSLDSYSDAIALSLSHIPNQELRCVLANLLNLDAIKRLNYFKKLCTARGLDWHGDEESIGSTRREFKATSFIPTPLEYSLDLKIIDSSERILMQKLSAIKLNEELALESPASDCSTLSNTTTSSTVSTNPSTILTASPDLSSIPVRHDKSLPPIITSSLTAPQNDSSTIRPTLATLFPPPVALHLDNSSNEPLKRAVSFIKYSLRCRGVLYSVLSGTGAQRREGEIELDEEMYYLKCVASNPVSPSSGALSPATAALRSLLRVSPTSPLRPDQRSSSAPASSSSNRRKGRQKEKAQETRVEEALIFYVSIRRTGAIIPTSSRTGRSGNASRNVSRNVSRSRNVKGEEIGLDRIVISLSDPRAVSILVDALSTQSPQSPPVMIRGRSMIGHGLDLKRSQSSGRSNVGLGMNMGTLVSPNEEKKSFMQYVEGWINLGVVK